MQASSSNVPFLGCIADDITGATDLAINLVQGGMRVVQRLGIPTVEEIHDANVDAMVVALKTRSLPAGEAVEQSLQALEAFRHASVSRFYFKYCSTFDSTAEGNIGPVAEALMHALQLEQTFFCPAFPRNGRTVYQGHLFVGSSLLHESGMQHHPLNPMTDANLVRFLGLQSKRQVGLLSEYDLRSGNTASRLKQLAADDTGLVIVDSIDDESLQLVANQLHECPLLTGGSGLARYLPEAYRAAGTIDANPAVSELPNIHGRSLIVSGSCSAATNRQVAWMRDRIPCQPLDLERVAKEPEAAVDALVAWAEQHTEQPTLLIYSTAQPDQVQQLKQTHGDVARGIEQALAATAATLVESQGFRRVVVAGGETSGAVVQRLGIESLRIGPEICAGVPWTESLQEPRLALALKSGNFGEDDFFEHALGMLP